MANFITFPTRSFLVLNLILAGILYSTFGSDTEEDVDGVDIDERFINLHPTTKTEPPCSIISALASLTTHTKAAKNTKGTVQIIADDDKSMIILKFSLSGLEPNSVHGLHIHAIGDLRENCNQTGSHLNPYNEIHGGPDDQNRHVGDIIANVNATSKGKFVGSQQFPMFAKNTPRLCGTNSVVGRSIVLHQSMDDLGRGNAETSKASGNSGPKISCGVFGILTEKK